jgi:Xaa-Pro aminopeptidase
MIPKIELERRWSVLEDKMEAAGVDLLLATSQENFFYLTGSLHPDQKAIPDRLAIAGLNVGGNLFALLSDLEFSLFKSQSPVREANRYVEFKESPISALANTLRERGMAEKRIGFEARHLVFRYFEELKRELPAAQLLPADDYFTQARQIKSPFEIELLRKAAQATEKAIFDTWRASRYGISEKEMGRELEYRLRKEGADAISFLTCVSGARTAIPHAASSSLPIERGDLIKIDFGGIFGGYVSDMARVAFMVEAPPARKAEYLRLLEAHKNIIEAMKPGTTASRVFERGREIFEAQGLPFDVPHLGHSLGLTGHEEPLLQPYDDTELKPGMLLAVEPRAGVDEKTRYHVEDLVLITNEGPKVLTDIQSNQEVFVIS